MTASLPTSRNAYRRTSSSTPSPKHTLVTEPLPPLSATSVLIAIRAVSLNFRDANIAVGNNPWPVIARAIPCNDGAGSVIAVGTSVTTLKIGDRVAPNIDTENITGRETKRSWLSADEDGVLADYVVFDERVLSLLPEYLDWEEACTVPCAGVTAWMALKGVGIGGTVLIQGM
jgi:NADPH:quinone reductase-like Zn-dependent oxidoreductase